MEEEVSGPTAAVAVGLCVVLVSLLLWLLRWFDEWRLVRELGGDARGSKLPPGSMGWPVIGEMLEFLWCFKFSRRPDDFIAKRKARYGDTGIYRTHLFGQPTIVTCSPELNKQILGCSIEDGTFSSGWPSNQLIGCSAIGIVEGQSHKRLRRHIMEAFNNPRALSSQLSTTQPIFISALEGWASKKKIVAYNETKKLTFRIICEILVSFQSEAMLDTMETLYRGLMAGLRSMTINIPGTTFHHAVKCREKLTTILWDELRRRRVQGIQKLDFMQILMDSVDEEDGNKLNEVEIVDNIVSLILGGYESTSEVMTWGLYYLAKYPDVLEKLKEETHSINKGKSPDELLTIEDIKSMRFTSKVTDELVRLANVSPFIFRRVAKDDVVINGYKFPKNWKVVVWIRSIHIDSKYYEDPLTFHPERWHDFKPRAGTYSVFGGGPRYCPGNNFTKFQLMIFLHYACLKYKWELVNPNAGFAFLPHPKPSDGAEMFFSRAII